MTTFVYAFCADYNNLDMVDGGPQNATITAMEENHVNEADVLQPAITELVAITEMETVVETENNFVGDEQQRNNTHTTTEPCPTAVTEDGDE
jgi:hypothetical protein